MGGKGSKNNRGWCRDGESWIVLVAGRTNIEQLTDGVMIETIVLQQVVRRQEVLQRFGARERLRGLRSCLERPVCASLPTKDVWIVSRR